MKDVVCGSKMLSYSGWVRIWCGVCTACRITGRANGQSKRAGIQEASLVERQMQREAAGRTELLTGSEATEDDASAPCADKGS